MVWDGEVTWSLGPTSQGSALGACPQVPSSVVPVGLLPEARGPGPRQAGLSGPSAQMEGFSASDTSLSRCDHQQHQSPSPWVP